MFDMKVDSVIIHDIRSTHNVGSILRTCDGFGIGKVYVGGFTPYPIIPHDDRLPHISNKLTKDIAKTALGAEKTIEIELYEDLAELIQRLKDSGTKVVALEQSDSSVNIRDFITPKENVALLLGREVEGIDQKYLDMCDYVVEIPMVGLKESFNVSVATGIALYSLT